METRILIAVLVLLAMIGCRKKPANDYEDYQTVSKDTTTVVADTNKQKAEVKEPEVKKEVIPTVDVDHPYFIVVASYTVEDFALAQKKELESQGLKPVVIMTDSDGWYKLAVQSFESYSDARQALPLLKEKQGIYSNAVIVYKK